LARKEGEELPPILAKVAPDAAPVAVSAAESERLAKLLSDAFAGLRDRYPALQPKSGKPGNQQQPSPKKNNNNNKKKRRKNQRGRR
jgi:hypothetical protein